MANFTAIYDACVLYPAPLRDFLLRLAMTELFRARWTAHIHGEWMRSVLNNRKDLTAGQLERTRQLMDQAVPDCLVTDYEDLIDSLELPDPDDRHVLAAATRCQAGVIVTFNLGDFPNDILRQYGIEANILMNSSAICWISTQAQSAMLPANNVRHCETHQNPPGSFSILYCDKGWQERLPGLKR